MVISSRISAGPGFYYCVMGYENLSMRVILGYHMQGT